MKKIALLLLILCAPVLAFGQTSTANTFRPTATPPAPPCPYYRVFLNLSNQMAKVDCLGNVTVIEGGGGGGDVGGTGTSGTIAKFTGTSNIGNSLISEAGSTVTIGGTTLNLRGLNYTFPAAHAAGALTNNGSGVFSYQAFAIPGGPTGAVQYQNGANVFEGSAGYVFDVASNTVTAGQSGLSGAFRIKNTNGNTVSLVTSAPGSSFALTLPNVTDTLVARTTTDNLSNKTLITPTIASFINANHTHADTSTGGQLSITAIASGSLTGAGPRIVTAATVPADGCAAFLSGNLTSSGLACGSGGGGTTSSTITVTKTSHGISVLTPVYSDNAGVWQVARNDTQSKWATGLVVGVPDVNTLTIAVSAGSYTVAAHGLDITQTYYLGDTGGLTTTIGSTNRQGVLVSLGTNSIQYFGILQNPGSVSGGGGAVSSVFGRTGTVVAANNDYSFSQISGTITNAMVNTSAGIAQSKLAALTASKVAVTDASGFLAASAVASTDIQNALKIQGRDVASTAPTNGQGLFWNSTNSRYEPGAGSGGGGGVLDPGANGVMVRTALNTTTARTIAGGLGIGVTNGDGVSGNPTIAVTGPIAVTTLTTNGIVYGNGTGAVQVTAASGTGTFCLSSTNGGPPSWTSCTGGGGSSTWNGITAATGNATIATSTFSTTFTNTTALTNAINNFFLFQQTSSGTVGVGFGTGMQYQLKTSTGAMQDAGGYFVRWANHVDGVRDAEAVITVAHAGSAGVSNISPVVHRADQTSLNPYDTTAGSTHTLAFFELAANGTNFTGFKAPDSLASSITYTLPSTAPSSGTNYALNWTAGNIAAWTQFQLPITANSPLALDGSNNLTCASCVTQSSGFITLTAVTFSGLGTPANGNIVYCSDCTIASPCAGSGTGALAKRLNSTWVCN